jgi:hypothetical protein
MVDANEQTENYQDFVNKTTYQKVRACANTITDDDKEVSEDIF